MAKIFVASVAAFVVVASGIASAEPPHASYIFPAGGQRGTTVKVRVGGHFLHDRAAFEILGEPGTTARPELTRTERVWFEGPLIKQPASQASEDYPQDYAGELAISAEAAPGPRWWRCWNAQGVTPPLPFVVGELPEVVEDEIDGSPIPVGVTLPVTINGRVFPREDVDIWTFDAAAGQSITCSVAARELGSPLTAKLEIRDPAGKQIVESTGTVLNEAHVRFVAPAAGRYAIHITDAAAGGLQHYVYRLTVTAGRSIDHVYPLGGRRGSTVRLETIGQSVESQFLDFTVPDVAPAVLPAGAFAFEVSDLPEHLEAEPNEAATQAVSVQAPAVLNGRIQSPGDVDLWSLQLVKGEKLRIESRVTELGSPLAIVLKIRGDKGQELAKADATTVPSGDPVLNYTPPADGTYSLEIRDRFTSRGGPAFAYRVTIAPPKTTLRMFAPDALAIDVGTTKNLEVQIERQGQWKSPLRLDVEGLPAGVTCEPVEVPPTADKAAMTFKVAENTPVVSTNLRIVGRAEVDGQPAEFVAVLAGDKDRFARGTSLPTRLAVTLPTPFKFTAQYSFDYAPRGGVLHKNYAIERGGYEGPFEVRLADRQGRHLQGVTGPTVQVAAGATSFSYPLHLPPWMELGRTSRSNLMLTGEVPDAAGKLHKVCYTTRDQNEQLIALVSPAPLRLSLGSNSVLIRAGGEVAVPIVIKRDATIRSPIKLELVVPPHVQGVSAEPVMAPPGAEGATLVLRFSSMPGPLNMPIMIRATAERSGDPIRAEASLELVVPRDEGKTN